MKALRNLYYKTVKESGRPSYKNYLISKETNLNDQLDFGHFSAILGSILLYFVRHFAAFVVLSLLSIL